MAVMHLSNGTIDEISSDRGTTLVTVSYNDSRGGRQNQQTVRLAAGPRTIILNQNSIPVAASVLRRGMTINAVFSPVMTRSIPPQAEAYLIEIVGRTPREENVTVGRIMDIDRKNRSFTTIRGRDFSSLIRFNVSDDTRIFDRGGRPMNFSRLVSGMQVRVVHANFMTASIPPQTSAFEVRVL